VIEGARVVLVPLLAADADELAGLLDDDYTRGALGVEDVDGLRARFARWEARRSPDGAEAWLNWVVRARDDRRALGWAQATVRSRSAGVAYALLASARGQGAASDAVRALVAWLRGDRGVEEVVAWIAPANAASGRVAHAAGFAPTARRDDDGEVRWVHAAPVAGGARAAE
jgi:RimJ/RimL family protein N-acetyltransferase